MPIRPAFKDPVFRFVLVFALLLGPFTLFFYGFLVESRFFDWYLGLNSRVSAGLLTLLGEEATAHGTLLASPRASLEIRYGCDAILPTAIFVAAVLASPVQRKKKLPAVLVGSAVLLSVNLLRVLSLYYTRVYYEEWFHTMHVEVWQPAFIFLALLLWVTWALRVSRGGAAQDEVES